MYQYDEACKSAADAQGITKLVAELAAHGITATVWQSGGFCMVAIVDLGNGFKINANEEGAVLWHDKNEDSPEHGCEMEMIAADGDDIAANIVSCAKQWRDGLAAMRAKRKRVESMMAALPNDYGCDVDSAGYLYDGCWHIEDFGEQFSVLVCNGEVIGSLEDCEAYLYGFWVRSNG